MNILITSAGRRSSLVEAFKAAAHPRGGRVLVADVDALAPTCALADGAFQVPKVTHPDYLATLLALCQAEGVRVVVPTIDTELPVLAHEAQVFRSAGILPVISQPAFIETCMDKWRTAEVFAGAGVAVPRSWLPGMPAPPDLDQVFVKPRRGSASLHAYAAPAADLPRLLPQVPDPILQELLDGREVTIDAFLDFDGRPLHYVPRERIRTLGGESIQGVTLDLPDLDAWLGGILGVCSRLGARGPLTLQAFLTARGPVLTEINPRFGGGFPLARAAGGDYPAWILDLAEGRPVAPSLGAYRRGLYMTRHYTEIFLDRLPWPL